MNFVNYFIILFNGFLFVVYVVYHLSLEACGTVDMNNSIFWDISPCNPLRKRRFRENVASAFKVNA
jgi:hypothetical protein